MSFEDELNEFAAQEAYLKEHPLPSNPFVRACADGDLDAVRRMIEDGADMDQRDQGYAEDFEHDGKTRTWRVADMRKPNTMGATGMEMAMRTQNLELVKLLYAAGANALAQDDAPHRGGHNAITVGIYAGFTEGVRFLVDECGLPLRTADDKGDGWMLVSAMHEKGSLGMLRYLVEEKGVDLQAVTDNGITAAHMACDKNAPPAFLEYCYQHNAVPQGAQHITPKGVISFHPEAVKDLEKITGKRGGAFNILEDGMTLIRRYGDESTYLNASVFAGDVEKVRIHLKYGANPFQTDDQGVDAFGVLKALRENDPRSIFKFRAEHAEIENILQAELAPKAAPAAPRKAPKGP